MVFCQECHLERVQRRNLFCDGCKLKLYKADKLWREHIKGKTLKQIASEQGLSIFMISTLLSKYLKQRSQDKNKENNKMQEERETDMENEVSEEAEKDTVTPETPTEAEVAKPGS